MDNRTNKFVTIASGTVIVAAFIAVYLIFGRGGTKPAAAIEKEARVASPTAIPGGIALGRFIPALASSGMNCTFKEPVRNGGKLCYEFGFDTDRTGRLALSTDALGRVTEATLEIPYVCGGEPGPWISPEVAARITEEYRRRESADAALIEAYIDALFSFDCVKIDALDIKKVKSGTVKAYQSGKTYDKKLSKMHFYCETNEEKANEYVFSLAFSLKY